MVGTLRFVHATKYRELHRHPEVLAALAASLEGWATGAPAAVLRDARKGALLRTTVRM
jgi:hypothetical protein